MDEFNKLYTDWLVLSEKYVKRNPIYAQLLLHCTIGQVYKYTIVPFNNEDSVGVELDGRIHIFDIEHQASGKNRPAAMIRKILNALTNKFKADRINITIEYKNMDSFTDAGLIGTYDYQSIVDADGNASEQRVPVLIPGILNGSATHYAIVLMQEASILFNTTSPTFRQEAMTYFNECMSSIHSGLNVSRKRLARNEVTCNGEVSLIFTTFPTRKIRIEDTNNGFFRRALVHYNDKSLDEAYNSTIDVWNKQGLLEEKAEVIIDRIADTLYKNFHNYENIEQRRITFDDEVRKFIQDWLRERNRLSKEQLLIGVDTSKLHLMRAFEATYAEKMLVIASHRAIIDGRHTIVLEDVKYASILINKLLDEVRSFINFVYNMNTHEGVNEEGDMRSVVLRAIINNKEGTLRLNQLVNKVVASHNERSPTKKKALENRVRYQIEKLKKENVIRFGDDNTIILMVRNLESTDEDNNKSEV